MYEPHRIKWNDCIGPAKDFIKSMKYMTGARGKNIYYYQGNRILHSFKLKVCCTFNLEISNLVQGHCMPII